MQDGGIDLLRNANRPIVTLLHVAREEERAKRRHQRERQHERATQGEHHGEGHRVKHFPFNAGQRENGQIDNGDDRHTEKHR